MSAWKLPKWRVNVLHSGLVFAGLVFFVHGSHVATFDMLLLGDDLRNEFFVQLDRGCQFLHSAGFINFVKIVCSEWAVEGAVDCWVAVSDGIQLGTLI